MICGSFDPITSNCAPCCFVCSYHPKCDKKETAASAPNTDSGKNAASQPHAPNNYFRFPLYQTRWGEST